MLNWRALRVSGGARSAIYDETFPADLADALRPLPDDVSSAFDQEAALAVLVTFATHWDDLRPDGPGRTDFIGLRDTQPPGSRRFSCSMRSKWRPVKLSSPTSRVTASSDSEPCHEA